MDYEKPELNDYGAVESITEGSGSNKAGGGNDEYSGQTGLTGSVF